MKAIYINIDPYLAAFVAWNEGGRTTPIPSFDPLPIALTLPLGNDPACFVYPEEIEFTRNGKGYQFGVYDGSSAGVAVGEIDYSVLSDYASSGSDSKIYTLVTNSVTFVISETDEGNSILVTIPVLVRREQASGPVDLVDFTPPASGGTPSAADIKSALVAAGNGALAGVQLGGAIIWACQDPSSETPTEGATLYTATGATMVGVAVDEPGNLGVCLGGATAS